MRIRREDRRKNDERLYALKDLHCGKRCFIIGNGPSLAMADLDRLQDEITFASNRITLAFEETRWRPTYYTLCDLVVARSNEAMVRALPMTKLFADFVRPIFRDDPKAVFLNRPRRGDGPEAGAEGGAASGPAARAKRFFASFVSAATAPAPSSRAIQSVIDDRAIPTGWNLLRGARAGHSVVNLSLKAAYWMGIREVYVLGVDHDFVLPASRPVDVVGGNEVYVSEGEQNHFHAEYRKPGEAWTYPKLEAIAEEFGNARSVFEAAGGSIKNASRSTKLDVWECVNLDDVLRETGSARFS